MPAIGSLSNIALGTVLDLEKKKYHPLALAQAEITLASNSVLAQKLIDVWAWLFFAINTTMTVSIIYKIL
jgi:hypothetical protein